MLFIATIIAVAPSILDPQRNHCAGDERIVLDDSIERPRRRWFRVQWRWVALVLAIPLLFVIVSFLVVAKVAQSHIEGNVPKSNSFDEYLSRDLNRYFCGGGAHDCKVEYEFLRNGPTQLGTSYPKYYLWAKKLTGGKVTMEGAVRVAAVDGEGFDVTDFLSRSQIVAYPGDVASIFPAPLVDKIMQKAR